MPTCEDSAVTTDLPSVASPGAPQGELGRSVGGAFRAHFDFANLICLPARSARTRHGSRLSANKIIHILEIFACSCTGCRCCSAASAALLEVELQSKRKHRTHLIKAGFTTYSCILRQREHSGLVCTVGL